MFTNVHYKGQGQVNNQWGAKSEKGCINEEQADRRSGNTEFLAQPSANPKGMLLKKVLNPLIPIVYQTRSFTIPFT